ncbi:MAG: hypothetical protein WA782_01300 [Sulfitobacter sp.]
MTVNRATLHSVDTRGAVLATGPRYPACSRRFSIRSAAPSGAQTELSNFAKANGDCLIYGHSNAAQRVWVAADQTGSSAAQF